MDRRHGIESFVLRVLAAACRAHPAALDPQTSMAELGMDSLTLVAVLSQVEAAYGLEFTTDDTLALMGAGDVGELVAAIELRAAPLDR
ncbi:MAG TPA: acyl carrier protein [Gammaproteobacteria bacterium]|nr:acyl carrier protein [Gammaproteobacteria bacterium]